MSAVSTWFESLGRAETPRDVKGLAKGHTVIQGLNWSPWHLLHDIVHCLHSFCIHKNQATLAGQK